MLATYERFRAVCRLRLTATIGRIADAQLPAHRHGSRRAEAGNQPCRRSGLLWDL